MTATPSRASCADERVHVGLGPDVDAARRLVEDEHGQASCRATSRASPSAGCPQRGSRPASRATVSGCRAGPGTSPRCPAPRSAIDQTPSAHKATEPGQRDVRRHRLRQRQPETATVLGYVRDVLVHRVDAGCWMSTICAVPANRAVLRGPDAEDRPRHLGAPGADQPRGAEDLTSPHLEGDVVKRAGAPRGARRSARRRRVRGPVRRKKSESSRPTMSRISETSVTSATGFVEMC